ncbi:MAG: NADase-type glycan-binding domain-containing protein, partial [Pseudonocardiaceae bacterium]
PKPPAQEPAPAAPEPKAGPEPGQRAAAALVAPPSPSTGPKPPTVPRQPDRGQFARKPQPQEMRPQAPVRRRPTAPPVQSPPTRQPQPDDLICGMCGEGNPPIRRFCSRCGNSLQTATVVPTPWWRKVLQFFTQRRVRPAGARPKRRPQLLTLRGLNSAFRRVLLVAALLAGLLYAVVPSLRGAVNELARGGVDRITSALGQKDVPVRPVSTDAAAQVPEHPARYAFDGGNNTFWKAPNADAKPTLVLKFDHPTQIERAIVHNGGSGEEFGVLARPRQLHVVYFNGETPSGVFDVTLEDKPDEQEVAFGRGDPATRVEIQVTDVYRAPDSPDLGLTEIELFERQS